MFLNILKTTINSLLKDKLYSFLNIMGLSISFCCFLIIILYLKNEITVDQHFEQHENIYRINTEVIIDGTRTYHAKSGALVGPLLAQNYEAFEKYVRLNNISIETAMLFLNGDISAQWRDVYIADENIFDVFSHNILAGNPDTALVEPRTMAVSESFAKLYFGDEDPIGKTIGVQVFGNNFTINLVFADLPDNTSLKYDVLFSYNTNPITSENSENLFERLVDFTDYTFIMLNENFDFASFADISDDFFERYSAEGALRRFPNQQARMSYSLQPIAEIYFSSPLIDDVPSGRAYIIYALSAIAFFLLLVASVNYMNLSTARSVKRTREVGIRRTLGANKSMLVMQFLTEGVVYSLLALLIGLSIAELLLSTGVVNSLLGEELAFSISGNMGLLAQLIAISVVLGLISGSYPALYFSSVKPIDIFKPIAQVHSQTFSIRTILISLQLLVSVCVIASTLAMNTQISYLKNLPLGFEKENKLVITLHSLVIDSEIRTLMNEFSRHSNIYSTTMADIIPGTATNSQPGLMENDQGLEVNQTINSYIVDANYFSTFGIDILEGRTFDSNYGDSKGYNLYDYIINESFVRMMGWENPIGKRIQYPLSEIAGQVIGVIADFNFASLHQELVPLVLEPYHQDFRWQRHLILDISPDNFQQTLAHIESLMRKFEPNNPLEYRFIDDVLDALYADEEKQMQFISIGTAMCIFISILGLLGLSSFMIDQKMKDIGIQRVLGASTSKIITKLFIKFFGLILVVSMVASILSFYLLNEWLDSFAYRITITPLNFILATVIVIVLTIIIMTLQVHRIAQSKPVEALRDE